MKETSARLLKLLSLLQARRDWSGADLADRLEISGRTLRHDIERLRSLGYPIEATRGVNGGYRLGAGAEMPPLLLEDDEAVAIAVSLTMAASQNIAGVEESGLRALTKLQQVLPTRLRNRVEALRLVSVRVNDDGPDGSVDAGILQAIATASRQHETVRMGYTRFDGSTSRRMVEPHQLVNWDRRWYLVAWDDERADWRTFRVDRIARVDPTGLRFLPRDLPDPDISAWVARNVARAGWKYEVEAIVHAPAADIVRRLPDFAGSVEAIDDQRCRLRTGADVLWSVAVYLSVLEADFEIVSPPELRDLLRQLGQRYLAASVAPNGAG